MGELFPAELPVLRERYEHVLVRRDGHLLEVTINRPAVRNSLHPMANDELDHVFNAFFADDDLWAAFLVGAGDKAFSVGNDLLYGASGQPMWVPKNGFGGLTSRRHLPKPVIAPARWRPRYWTARPPRCASRCGSWRRPGASPTSSTRSPTPPAPSTT
jgi:acetyl-CoA C-acetyltransferase